MVGFRLSVFEVFFFVVKYMLQYHFAVSRCNIERLLRFEDIKPNSRGSVRDLAWSLSSLIENQYVEAH